MNLNDVRKACYALGMVEPISVEPDGTVWLGIDPDRVYPDMDQINKKVAEIENQRIENKQNAREKLRSLGLTDEEINALVNL